MIDVERRLASRRLTAVPRSQRRSLHALVELLQLGRLLLASRRLLLAERHLLEVARIVELPRLELVRLGSADGHRAVIGLLEHCPLRVRVHRR